MKLKNDEDNANCDNNIVCIIESDDDGDEDTCCKIGKACCKSRDRFGLARGSSPRNP